MTKLNQIIAVEKGVKSRVYGEITALHKASQKAELFNGLNKTYRPKGEEDEVLPPETKRVQYSAMEVLKSVQGLTTELLDVTAKKDWSNCEARADVVVEGQVLIEKAPVTYLLFLEKQLTDIKTFINSLPILDEGDDWKHDKNSGLYKTEPSETHRTKKVVKPIVLYHATEQHPAQTQMISEDVISGFWVTVKLSGAFPKPEKQKLQQKIEALLEAVKQAREEANGVDVVEAPSVGNAIFSYLFS